MKTSPRLIRTSVGIIASGLFAAYALAGPGPQYWQQMEKARADAAAAKSKASPAAKCDGCKTTPIWVVNDRGPAGKGAPGARVVGQTHTCTRCTGAVATQNGQVKDGMARAATCTTCCK